MQCPLCGDRLEQRPVAPCFDCGAEPQALEELRDGSRTYARHRVFGRELVLCDVCDADVPSKSSRDFGLARLPDDEHPLERLGEIEHPAPTTDWCCATCERRLAFLRFLREVRARHGPGNRLPHHPELVDTLRVPTDDDPWRVLVSGCIFGWKVAVDGTTYGLDRERPAWVDSPKVELIPFCPEDQALGTPRAMPDLHDGDGFAVLDGTATVRDPDGRDLTGPLLASARAMADLARERRVDFALLTDRSGACGSQVISVGCRLQEPVEYRRGVGVAAALLLREGVPVVSHRDHRTLELLRAKAEPGHVPDVDALDHHEHPWVVEHLPEDGA